MSAVKLHNLLLVALFYPLAFIFVLIISLVWPPATLYSVGYRSYEGNRTRYYLLLLIVPASSLGVVITRMGETTASSLRNVFLEGDSYV